MAGIFTPAASLPVADPYRLSIAKAKDSPPRAVGFVPNEEVAENLRRQIAAAEGSSDLTLATGDISDDWGQDVVAVVDAIDTLDTWRVSLSGNQVEVEGATTQSQVYETLLAALDAGLLGTLEGTPDITLEEFSLAPQRVETILATNADCGPVFLVDQPLAGYGPDSTIIVRGTLSSEESRVKLRDAIAAIAGNRSVRVDTNILNPTLCLIESVMPKAPSSAIDIAFFQGDQDNIDNPTGEFVVGENPVIDIVLPADVVEGYLTVSVLDVSGNVFHLLPNINRTDNSVGALRDGREGEVAIRVAYSITEAQGNGGLAFRVDDSTLGKTKVLVIHSSEKLFDEMRPTSESALSYTEALLDEDRNAASRIYSLDSRILETRAR